MPLPNVVGGEEGKRETEGARVSEDNHDCAPRRLLALMRCIASAAASTPARPRHEEHSLEQ